MQIQVGFTHNQRQVNLTIDANADALADILERSASETTTLVDTSGRTLIVAPGQLAYIEVMPERTQKVGFGVG